MAKSGIHIKAANKGKLHAKAGVPEGKKIPVSKLESMKNSPNASTRKQATFALNSRSWGKGK